MNPRVTMDCAVASERPPLAKCRRLWNELTMVVYEVNITVEKEIEPEYAEFLSRHISQLLKLPGFQRATWWERRAEDENPSTEAGPLSDQNGAACPAPPCDTTLWTVHYEVASRADLDCYLTHQATQMRAEAKERFGSRFHIQRRILSKVSDTRS